MFKIVFVTDLHIADEAKSPSLDKWRTVLKDIVNHENADFIILGGDLCLTHGYAPTYTIIKDDLNATGIPYCVISGNHDDSILLAANFGMPLKQNETYYKREIAGHTMLFLDTSLAECSDAQWKWIEDILKQMDNSHVYIFMHHPPIIAHVNHMEVKYSFTQMARWSNLMAKHSDKTVRIFTGHYHNDITIKNLNQELYVTPSVYVQIDDRSPEFNSYHTNAGYRRIWLDENNYLYTTVRYLF